MMEEERRSSDVKVSMNSSRTSTRTRSEDFEIDSLSSQNSVFKPTQNQSNPKQPAVPFSSEEVAWLLDFIATNYPNDPRKDWHAICAEHAKLFAVRRYQSLATKYSHLTGVIKHPFGLRRELNESSGATNHSNTIISHPYEATNLAISSAAGRPQTTVPQVAHITPNGGATYRLDSGTAWDVSGQGPEPWGRKQELWLVKRMTLEDQQYGLPLETGSHSQKVQNQL